MLSPNPPPAQQPRLLAFSWLSSPTDEQPKVPSSPPRSGQLRSTCPLHRVVLRYIIYQFQKYPSGFKSSKWWIKTSKSELVKIQLRVYRIPYVYQIYLLQFACWRLSIQWQEKAPSSPWGFRPLFGALKLHNLRNSLGCRLPPSTQRFPQKNQQHQLHQNNLSADFLLVGGFLQPSWKICERQIGSFLQVFAGWKFKEIF